MSFDTQEVIKSNPKFYRNNYRRAVVALILAQGIIIILCLIVFYLYKSTPERMFYATTSTGRVIELCPCITPNNCYLENCKMRYWT